MDVRVRLVETDALGVVYYGQYFAYFDISRLEMLRKLGITLDYLRQKNFLFVAAEALCRYRSSARFDDVLTLGVRVERVGSSSVTYAHEITKGGVVLAEGKVTDVLVGEGGKPSKITDEMREMLQRYS
jgi:acyl-CoA thioester hydrolase